MNFDGVDLVVHGPGRTSLTLTTRPWLEGGSLVGTEVNPDLVDPVSMAIRLRATPEAEQAARAGFSSFHTQIEDVHMEGVLSSRTLALNDGLTLHDFRADLGGNPYRVILMEDPFPLLLIPVVVGICALAASVRHRDTMHRFTDLARECMSRGGSAKIFDESGASVAFDSSVKVSFTGKRSFVCVMPHENQ